MKEEAVQYAGIARIRLGPRCYARLIRKGVNWGPNITLEKLKAALK